MTRPGWAAGAKVGERPSDAAERDDNGDDQLCTQAKNLLRCRSLLDLSYI